jgi:hypothetical protein
MKAIYTSLCKRLFEQVTGLTVVDLYNGQYENGETISAPAIYIEFLATQWEDVGNNCQEGDVPVRLHVCYSNLSHTEAAYENPEPISAALEFLDFVETVHIAVQGFEPDNSGPLGRTTTEPDTNNVEGLYVWRQVYTCKYLDESTNPENKQIQITPGLKVTHPIPEA